MSHSARPLLSHKPSSFEASLFERGFFGGSQGDKVGDVKGVSW